VLFRKARKKAQEDNPERWLLTYADLITLLLAFFIVMYSMSRIDAKRFGKVSQALHGILKGGPSVRHIPELETLNTGHGLLKVGDLKMLQTAVHTEIEKLGRKGDIVTEMNERGLIIHIMESAMFDEGKALLKSKALEVLDLVAKDIVRMPNHVRVEGHTDDRPIRNENYPSNWELSTARATTVVRHFIDKHGYPPDQISAVGFSQHRPYVPNISIENRALNRRVDVVVLTMELSAAEPSSDIDRFARQEFGKLLELKEEIDSLVEGNNIPDSSVIGAR
jgi:chemotaxis protein MotB